MRLFSTEQVSKYHPDKACDQVSDALLTAYLKEDQESHCGIETMWKGNTVILGGEVTSRAKVPVESIVNRVADKLGYKADTIINLISRQSPEIDNAVRADRDIGAGDQGMMYGYATRETPSRLPYGFDLANRIIDAVSSTEMLRKGFKGDAKVQVTVDLDKTGVDSLRTILVSACHDDALKLGDVRRLITDKLRDEFDIGPAMLLINPAGTWTIGGPTADCGLTGRKIVADQYGGYCPVGGGAFSGKDPTKVDRSAAYAARRIACRMLDKFDLDWCELQLAYAIGISEPVGLSARTSDDSLNDVVSCHIRAHEDLTPKGIIRSLGLLDMDYETLAEGCHYRWKL